MTMEECQSNSMVSATKNRSRFINPIDRQLVACAYHPLLQLSSTLEVYKIIVGAILKSHDCDAVKCGDPCNNFLEIERVGTQ
jgi:hypothetical protein